MLFAESATNISERFTLFKTLKTWELAQNYCRTVYTDLAKIQNQAENAHMQVMVKGGEAWTGLTGLSWQWSDGSIPAFIPWKPQEPLPGGVLQGDCTALDFSSTTVGMVDISCFTPQSFFCYISKTLFSP